ncbi:MAG TPA: GspH/FimT family pseudopilin [Burkholderiaceae bacterium]|nr:GspH/FimT family pseudopilin [Burkholderiaceae bacterium]
MKQRGFTIIEIVIVITITAFLLAAVMPSAGAWVRNSRIRTAAESISNGLQQARAEAVRQNKPVSFFLVSDSDAMSMSDNCALSSSSSGWVVAFASPVGKCATNRDSFIAVRAPGDTATSLSVVADATTVTFNGFGQVSNAGAITCIKLSVPSDTSTRTLAIGVQGGGQVRMCDAKVSDANDPRYCLAPAAPTVGCN